MSWRDTLDVLEKEQSIAMVNIQDCSNETNLVNVAACAPTSIVEQDSKLLEVLSQACQKIPITPLEVKQAFATEDVDDWCNGLISINALTAFAQALVQRRQISQGKRPAHYTKQAICKHCGLIWLWFSGEVMGCPWCLNRVTSKPILRPCSVDCGGCIHFDRTSHAHIGHCSKGEPEAAVGLWDDDKRYCERYLPRLVPTSNDQRGLTACEPE